MKEASALLQSVQKGNLRALSRLISWAEDRDSQAEEVLAALFPNVGRAQVFGITGPPGAGKSTLIKHFIGLCRKRGQKVAVVAVDPVSPFTGGALLGDRIRMAEYFNDPGVYIRSLSTRGKLGGLSLATREVVHALDAFGFDVIFLETVGVGQSEVEIRKLADATLVVLVPEWGDGIQALKAGILEIGDVFAVHKADREGAERVASELRQATQERVPQPELLLTQEKDPATIQTLLEALQTFVAAQAPLVQKRREQGRLDTFAELVEARAVQKAKAWAAQNSSAQRNPYEGYLQFQKQDSFSKP